MQALPHDIRLFERYYHKKLSHKEAVDFEMRLSLDETFRDNYHLYKLLVASAHHQRKKTLVQYIKTNASTKLTGNIWGNTWTRISLLIVVLVGLLIFLVPEKPQHKHNSPPKPLKNPDSTIVKPS